MAPLPLGLFILCKGRWASGHSHLLQQALHTLQEEQTRLKMRLQELQQLKRELGDAPQGKVS